MRRRADTIAAASHPAELASLCEPDYVITPAVDLISRNVERVLRSRRKRLMITMPPQEGKSTVCSVWTPLRALQLHPNWRIMLLTYADGLAEEHAVAARTKIQHYGSGVVDTLTGSPLPDRLGLSLSADKATAGNWRIQEGDGGLVAAGRDATITGLRADLIIIDDPFKNMQEADSAAIRHKVNDWYRSVALTRLAPGASVIVIQTRWHPEDLAGTILAEDFALPAEKRQWRYLNIPAVSHPELPDALGRPPGVPMVSARGRTAADFADTERSVGKRVWNALFQGSPTPPEGGLFSGEWFDQHRMDEMPERTRVRIVAVDPSESGEGDEAGVIAAAMLTDGRTVFTHDRSAQMTSDQWAAAAVSLALDTDASDIYIETYTAALTYVNVVKAHIKERMERAKNLGMLDTYAHLARLVHRVHGWRGTGDAVARSGLLRQAVEVGTAVVLGHEMAELEIQAKRWMTGSHQPDRVAAAVIAHDRLVAMRGQQAVVAKPGAAGVRTAPGWLTRKVG